MFVRINFLLIETRFFQQLEKLLERRPTERLPISGESVEEVPLAEYDHHRHENRAHGREAYDDSEDDEDMRRGGPQQVQCATH